MSFFSNIFGKNGKKSINGLETGQSDPLLTGPNLKSFENIFVNPEPPVQEKADNQSSESALEEFLARDYYAMGYDEGYKTHSAEAKINHINVIKATFRQIMSRKIDQLRQEVLSLENYLIDVEGDDKRLEMKLNNRIKYIMDRCGELEKEKALSVDDEGLVMEPINKFANGFAKGLQIYTEEKLLASSTGMFD